MSKETLVETVSKLLLTTIAFSSKWRDATFVLKTRLNIAVIGCGIGGSLFLEHLTKALKVNKLDPKGVSIRIYNPAKTLGAGIPFGADLPSAAINTTFQRLNQLGANSCDFESWLLETNGLNSSLDEYPVSRSQFGAFLKSRFKESVKTLSQIADIQIIDTTIKDIEQKDFGVYKIYPEKADPSHADIVVLAIGTWPRPTAKNSQSCYPLRGLLSDILAREPNRVVIAGTGLSAIDASVTLAQQGVPTTMMSPSGRLPWVQVLNRQPQLPRFLNTAKVKYLHASGNLYAESLIKLLDLECTDAGTNLQHILSGENHYKHWQAPTEDLANNRAYDRFSLANFALNLAYQRLHPGEKQMFLQKMNGNWRRFRFRIPLNRWKQIRNFQNLGLIEICSGDPFIEFGESISQDIYLVDARGFSTQVKDCPLLHTLESRGILGTNRFGQGVSNPDNGALLTGDSVYSDSLFGIGNIATGSNIVTSALDMLDQQAQLVAHSILRLIFCKSTDNSFPIDQKEFQNESQ